MAGVVARVVQPGGQYVRGVVRNRLQQRQGALGIRRGVERHDTAAFEAHGLAVREPLVQELGILFMDMRRVAQHPVAQIDGGRSGEDGTAEAALTRVGRLPEWSMWACERTTASMEEPGNGRLRFLRSASFRRPWCSPQSSRKRRPPDSTRCIEPVTSPAAPQNVSFICHPPGTWCLLRKGHGSALRNRRGEFCLDGGACFSLPV